MTRHREGLNVAELRDFKLNPKTADPVTPTPGVAWTRSDQNHIIKYNDGTTNQTLATQAWTQSNTVTGQLVTDFTTLDNISIPSTLAVSNYVTAKTPFIGATYPGTPAVGALWFEVNAAGVLLGDWCWDGVYWLSQNTTFHTTTTLSTAFNAAVNTVDFPVDPNFNLFIVNFISCVYLNATSVAASNSWTWALSRNTSTNVSINLTTINTGTLPANTWGNFKNPVNLHINVASTATRTLRIRETRVGTLQKMCTIQIEFKKARI